MSRILPTICLLLIPSTSFAELMAEWTWNFPKTITATPAEYRMGRFSAGIPGPSTSWNTETSNLNTTFVADEATVEAFDNIWTSGYGPWTVINFTVFDPINRGQNTGHFAGTSVDWILETPDSSWTSTRHVPKLGHVFYGYDLTGLERIVTPTSHGIKVYGRALTMADADANGDGIVDAADYPLVSSNYGKFNWWKDHFGMQQSAGLGSAAIPEPSPFAMTIILCGILAAMLTHNHRILRRHE